MGPFMVCYENGSLVSSYSWVFKENYYMGQLPQWMSRIMELKYFYSILHFLLHATGPLPPPPQRTQILQYRTTYAT